MSKYKVSGAWAETHIYNAKIDGRLQGIVWSSLVWFWITAAVWYWA